jgi:hypothetical protein
MWMHAATLRAGHHTTVTPFVISHHRRDSRTGQRSDAQLPGRCRPRPTCIYYARWPTCTDFRATHPRRMEAVSEIHSDRASVKTCSGDRSVGLQQHYCTSLLAAQHVDQSSVANATPVSQKSKAQETSHNRSLAR